MRQAVNHFIPRQPIILVRCVSGYKRGYDADFSVTYMNGIPVYNIDNGLTPFGQWSWLNDVMRNREVVTSLRPTTYAFWGAWHKHKY